ncbi:MAG: efflux RND transporter periplasmic adaptor subunit [Deltaproteobacteria bacterium]|nr:efflux RND transporter periplasmic adaptor subunit [Deltaproteobacteria bacterium]
MKKKILLVVVMAVVLALGGFYFLKSKGNGVQFKTARVPRGDLRATVTATGTVSAVTTVQVGTQVSGTVKQLFVDYNSPVKQGQLLAQIDPALSEAKVAQTRANLLAASANVEKAEAALTDAERTLERNRTLFARNFIARSDLDTSDTNRLSALAQLNVAKAQVEQQKAALNQEETNLNYTRILSPVDGVVISRNVDIGQTVAASFQTPTLFSIAQDLTRMQIDTNVDEADIGKVRVGQPVQFTVDAYPEITFPGKVAEIRNAPTTIQNVVTYDVVVKVANPELKLKPGMTANVSIITALEKGVLKVPNTALRFKWQPAGVSPDRESAGAAGAGRSQTVRAETGAKTQGVWILDGKKPRRAPLTLGISDGNNTAVLSGEIKEGDAVIIEATGQEKKGASQSGGPRFF